jgi:tol-pal system protein YbgF
MAQVSASIAALGKRIDKLELLIIAGQGNNSGLPTLPKMKSSIYMWPSDRAGYEDGRTTYSLKNYKEAIAKLQEFLKVYGSSKYRPDAHYYLGESLLATGKYLEGVVQFGEIIEKYPKSNKLAMSYLRAGMAYKKLKDKKKARMFLNAVVKKFKGRAEADRAKKELRGL